MPQVNQTIRILGNYRSGSTANYFTLLLSSLKSFEEISISNLVLTLASVPEACAQMTLPPIPKRTPYTNFYSAPSFSRFWTPARAHESYPYSGVEPRQTTSSK